MSTSTDNTHTTPPAAEPPRRTGLHAKLIIPYLLLTLALAIVGTFVVTLLVASSLRERLINRIVEASRVAADGIVRQEKVHLEVLRAMAFTQGVPEAMLARDTTTLNEFLMPIVRNTTVEAFSVIDRQGRELFTQTLDREANQYLFSEGADFSGWPLVAAILAQQQDDIGDKFIALVSTTRGPYLFTSAPVMSEATGELAGVILVGTRLTTIIADLKTQAAADVILLDSSYALLATTLPEPDEGYAVLEEAARAEGAVIGLTNLKRTEVTLYTRQYEIGYSPLIVRRQTLGVLGVVLPSDYVTTAALTNRNLILLIFVLGTLAVILIGYRLAQSIARPISRLRVVSQAVAAGDLNQNTGLNQPDEIGDLAHAFDAMTVNLRERTAEAARLYTETAQRNKDLAEANAKLQMAQQQLVQSEKLAAVGQLTAGIVHDVKNPLAIIIGLAEEVPEHNALDDFTRESLHTISESGRRANKIVSDLLKFAREATPDLARQDLRETIETVLRLTEYLARRARVQVARDLPAEPVMVTYDAAQMEQVFMNLVQNAIQAMPTGGRLRLVLRPAAEAVALAIQDTGTGIAPQNLSRIFDPFFTTKPRGEGTGLGLSVSYGIVARHGGRIDVESQLGEGTTFTVLLPLHPPRPAEAQPMEEADVS